MKVYRYATKDEIDNILSGKIDKVGRTYTRMKCNTHRYKKNTRYLHFFKNLISIEEIKRVKKHDKRTHYVCEYDIPMIVLMLGRGIGYYNAKGYDEDIGRHVEYIVPNYVMKPGWLKNYYLENVENLPNLLETAN